MKRLKNIKTRNDIEEIYKELIDSINKKDINEKINSIKNILKGN